MNSESKRIVLQVVLFVITFVTTTLAGAELAYGKSLLDAWYYGSSYTWSDFFRGMEFSIPLMLFLTCHEFGHYFTAIYHKVKTSLPYYIPFPPLIMTIGTLGAVIRLRSRPASNLQSFDIGLAGPLAGFVVALAILFYGFSTLPPAEHIFELHPEYKQYGLSYADHVYDPDYIQKEMKEKNIKGVVEIRIGSNIVFKFFEKFVADPSRIPNSHEIMHYPILVAGFLALFFTCLNLLPIGQLDGGHVIYGLFGFKAHRIIGSAFLIALLFIGGLGFDGTQPFESPIVNIVIYLAVLYGALLGLKLSKADTVMYMTLIVASHFVGYKFFPEIKGNPLWLVFGFIAGRFIGVPYPQSDLKEPLDGIRMTLGWIALAIFVTCFTLSPLNIEIIELKALQ